jgi:hypothetical protein
MILYKELFDLLKLYLGPKRYNDLCDTIVEYILGVEDTEEMDVLFWIVEENVKVSCSLEIAYNLLEYIYIKFYERASLRNIVQALGDNIYTTQECIHGWRDYLERFKDSTHGPNPKKFPLTKKPNDTNTLRELRF